MQIFDNFYLITTTIIVVGISVLLYMYNHKLAQENRSILVATISCHNLRIQYLVILACLPSIQARSPQCQHNSYWLI